MKTSVLIKRICFMGLLLAVSVVLGFLENMIPPIPTLPPGIKLGLSNVVVMYSLFCLKKTDTALIVVIKSLFVLLTRGVTAGIMSFFGGAVSTVVMIILLMIFKQKISILLVSIFGAVFHNIAQIFVAALLIGSIAVVAYLPLLIISGVLMGYVTGIMLRVIMPAITRVNPNK